VFRNAFLKSAGIPDHPDRAAVTPPQGGMKTATGGLAMLRWTLIFLIIALIAAVLGFGGIAASAAAIAKVLFFIFLIFFVISLFAGITRRV